MKTIFKYKKNSGFSLIELSLVMGLVGVVGYIATGFIGGMSKSEKRLDNSLEMQEYQRQLKRAFYKKEVCEQIIPKNITTAQTNLNEVSYPDSVGGSHKIVGLGKLNASSLMHVTKISFELSDFKDLKNFSVNEKYAGITTLSIDYEKCPKGVCEVGDGRMVFTKQFAFPISGVVTDAKTLTNVECDVKFNEFLDRAVLASVEGFGLVKYMNPINGKFEGDYGLPVYIHDGCSDKSGLALSVCEKSKKKLIAAPNGGVDTLSKAFCDLNVETMFDVSKAAAAGTTLPNADRFLMYTQFCPQIKSANCIWNSKAIEPGQMGTTIEAFRKDVFHWDNLKSLFEKYDDRFKNSTVAQNQSLSIYRTRGGLSSSGLAGDGKTVLGKTPVEVKAVLLTSITGPFAVVFGMLDICPKYQIQTNYQCTDSQMQYSSAQMRDSKFSWVPSASKCGTNTNCIKIFGKKICITLPRGPCCYYGPWQSATPPK
jgi:prepilin-type N-terminal cleavage/methylation domain-containing protein